MTERNDGTTEQSPPEKGASWKRFQSGPLSSERRFCGTIPSKGVYLEKGCQLFGGGGYDRKKFQQVKQAVNEVLEWWNGLRGFHDIHVRMMEWCGGLNCRILEWRGGDIIAIKCLSKSDIQKWCPGMVFWNGLCLGIMKRCLGIVIQNMPARYVKTELSAGICRFVRTVSVKV